MDTKTAVIAYVLTFGWVAFVWLYLKPKVAKKQNEKLEKFIDSIEKIHKNTKKMRLAKYFARRFYLLVRINFFQII
jgi:hypothetical protein